MVSHSIFVNLLMRITMQTYRFYATIASIFSFSVFVLSGTKAQSKDYTGIPSLVWPVLYDIQYEKAQDEYGAYDRPVFSEAVKKMAGQEITLPGYIIPFEGTNQSKAFMFSSLPLNACFFCGVGGPETVVQVRMAKPIDYNDKPVEIRGRLKLNPDNPDEHFYILDDAMELGPVSW